MSENKPLEVFKKRIYRKSRSEGSVGTYTRAVNRFLKHEGLTAEELANRLQNSGFDMTEALNHWLDDLNERGIAPKTQRIYYYAVKKFVGVLAPDAQVNWKTVDLPKTWSVEEDRPPTKQELKNILNHGNLKDRALVLFAVSSGVREGTLAELQVGDIDFNAYEDIALVKVRPEIAKQRIGYVTFITPEAKKALKQYLDLRKRKKQAVMSESRLFGITSDSIRGRWIRLLKRAGKDEKGRTFYTLHFHTLRKFFRTNLELVGVSTSFRERLLGHKGEYLDESYFKPQVQALLNEYRKAIPNLTIMEPVAEYEEMRKRQLVDTARLLGFGDEKLSRLQEVLARAKTTDEAIEKFKRLGENPEPKEDNGVKVVSGEKALVDHLKQGWTLVKELNHDKYLLKKGRK
jgi:integrase